MTGYVSACACVCGRGPDGGRPPRSLCNRGPTSGTGLSVGPTVPETVVVGGKEGTPQQHPISSLSRTPPIRGSLSRRPRDLRGLPAPPNAKRARLSVDSEAESTRGYLSP